MIIVINIFAVQEIMAKLLNKYLIPETIGKKWQEYKLISILNGFVQVILSDLTV
jgi:hypothetical protein